MPVRTYFGLDSRLATGALAALTRVPGASRAPRRLPLPGSERWLVLARAASGATRWATGTGEARATAAVAALAARRAAGLPAGVHHLHDLVGVDDLPPGPAIRLGGAAAGADARAPAVATPAPRAGTARARIVLRRVHRTGSEST